MSVTIDRTLRETAQAEIRVMVKWTHNKFGHAAGPHDEPAKTALRQAQLSCVDWAEASQWANADGLTMAP